MNKIQVYKDIIMFDFGVFIKQQRTAHNMTQKELGKYLNVSEAMVSRYESNTAVPPLETLRSIAVIFNVSMDTLCGIQHAGSLSVHGLNENQRQIVSELIDRMRGTEITPRRDDSADIYRLIGRIVAELVK